MATIDDILKLETATQIVAALKEKSISVPTWGGKGGLLEQYDPKKHPVMRKELYPDIVGDKGQLIPVTRVKIGLQKLAVRRMTELCTGIPIKRVYKPENDRQKEVAEVMSKIFERNRIDSVDRDRCKRLFAACEVLTLWYAVEETNTLYGVSSKLKMRCRTFSPMDGDELFPLFDEYGDCIALSIGYKRKVAGKTVNFFDAYTATKHLKFSSEGGWKIVEDDDIELLKIPAIYMYRPEPIWEDTSENIYEMEWSLSRNGNYLRENSKPLFCVFADEAISYGDEKEPEAEGKAVMQYPKGSSAAYVTWQQATESLKFHINELRNWFFTELQLPDWSYEKMAQTAMSGESRKQLFIDAQLKVGDESGRLVEFFDREVNVLRAFLKKIMGDSYASDIDALPVEVVITPFVITDEKDTIENLMTATGGEPIISQREAIEQLGWSSDVDKTLEEINAQKSNDLFELTE